jgi:hypothetical protein
VIRSCWWRKRHGGDYFADQGQKNQQHLELKVTKRSREDRNPENFLSFISLAPNYGVILDRMSILFRLWASQRYRDCALVKCCMCTNWLVPMPCCPDRRTIRKLTRQRSLCIPKTVKHITMFSGVMHLRSESNMSGTDPRSTCRMIIIVSRMAGSVILAW